MKALIALALLSALPAQSCWQSTLNFGPPGSQLGFITSGSVSAWNQGCPNCASPLTNDCTIVRPLTAIDSASGMQVGSIFAFRGWDDKSVLYLPCNREPSLNCTTSLLMAWVWGLGTPSTSLLPASVTNTVDAYVASGELAYVAWSSGSLHLSATTTIPNDPSWVGVMVYVQSLTLFRLPNELTERLMVGDIVTCLIRA